MSTVRPRARLPRQPFACPAASGAAGAAPGTPAGSSVPGRAERPRWSGRQRPRSLPGRGREGGGLGRRRERLRWRWSGAERGARSWRSCCAAWVSSAAWLWAGREQSSPRRSFSADPCSGLLLSLGVSFLVSCLSSGFFVWWALL